MYVCVRGIDCQKEEESIPLTHTYMIAQKEEQSIPLTHTYMIAQKEEQSIPLTHTSCMRVLGV
jgi:hypothetical protein